MKKIRTILLLTIGICLSGSVFLSAPVRSDKDSSLHWETLADGLELTTVDFSSLFRKGKIYAIKVGPPRKLKILLGEQKSTSLAELEAKNQPLVTINGSYFQENYQPSGLLKINNKLYYGLNKFGGSGILGISEHQISIFHKKYVHKLKHKFPTLMQNGPLLVEDDGKMGIYSNDRAYSSRTAICLSGDSKTILIVADYQAAPSLWELANILVKPEEQGGFNCKTALNLDGGTSTGLRINLPQKKLVIREAVPIANGIGVF